MRNSLSQWLTTKLGLLNPKQRYGRTVWAIALNAALIMVFTCFFLYQETFFSNLDSAGKAIAKTRAEAFINNLDTSLKQLQNIARQTAEQLPLRQAIEQQDIAAQNTFLQQLQSSTLHLVTAQILTPTNTHLDLQISPPVNFSALKALDLGMQNKVPPVYFQQAGEQKLLVVTYPVATLHPTKTPQALLMLYFNFSSLIQQMQINQTPAYLTLNQGDWQFYQMGNATWQNSPYQGQAQDAKRWTVHTYLDPHLSLFSESASHFWLIVTIGTTLLLLTLLISFLFIAHIFEQKKKTTAADDRKALTKPLPTAKEKIQSALPPASIFRAYDIRGIFDDTLTAEDVRLIGQAIGSEVLSQGQNMIAAGRDGRLSGPILSQALINGITSTGCAVQDIQQVPTPILYFAAKQLNSLSGVMLTGSHNPANYNGLKIVINDKTLSGDTIQNLRTRLAKNQITRSKTPALTIQKDVVDDYLQQALEKITLGKPMTVVIDAGNGVAGPTAEKLLSRLGCRVIPLFCDIDGNFPNHHPDPSKPENLAMLIATVEQHQADIGLAFDGDGDRLGVVTSAGHIIYPDRLLMLFAKAILAEKPGADIIFDVKCSRHLAQMIKELGGKPIMSATGHSFIKNKLQSTGAPLAGEMSGHIFFNDRWFGFDDALYTAVRLLEILSHDARSSEAIFAELPQSISTPEINISVRDDNKFSIIQQLINTAQMEDGQLIDIDGLRVEYPDGWGLVRASNTTPVLVARFEADTEAALTRIQGLFRDNLLRVDPDLEIPF